MRLFPIKKVCLQDAASLPSGVWIINKLGQQLMIGLPERLAFGFVRGFTELRMTGKGNMMRLESIEDKLGVIVYGSD